MNKFLNAQTVLSVFFAIMFLTHTTDVDLAPRVTLKNGRYSHFNTKNAGRMLSHFAETGELDSWYFFTGYTSSQSGPWNSSSTWGLAGVPSSGDTAILNNGFIVTVPAGYAAAIGTSPTDDTGTVALQCQATNGTGVLSINGSFTWKGPIRQCNANWTLSTASWAGAGDGSIIYDASGAATPLTAQYTWQISQVNGSTNALFTSTGNSTHHAVITSATSATPGGWGTMGTAFTDGGSAHMVYTDIDHQGQAGTLSTNGFFWKFRPTTGAGQFYLDHVKIDNSGQINAPTSISAGSTFSLTYVKITNPINTAYTLQIEDTVLCSGCTRLIDHSVIYGNGYIDPSSGTSTGFTITNNVFAHVFGSAGGGMTIKNGGSAVWDQNLIFDQTNSSSADGYTLPTGTLSNSILFRHCDGVGTGTCSNTHPLFFRSSSIDATLTGWTMEYDGADVNSDMVEPATDATVGGTKITVSYNVFLPNSLGNAIGSFLNNSSSVAQTNLKLIFDHNMGFVSGTAGSTVLGVGCEVGTSWPTGAVPAITNNIAYRKTSGTGPLVTSGGACTVSNGAVTVADWNDAVNLTASIYGNPSNQFLVAPTGSPAVSAHDVAINPNYVDDTRNFFNSDTGFFGHSVGTTWTTSTVYAVGDIVSLAVSTFHGNAVFNYKCVTAHTSGATTQPGLGNAWAETWIPATEGYIEDNVLAGTVYPGGYSAVGAVNGWIRKGFVPTNAAIATAASDGTTIGPLQYVPSAKANRAQIF